MDKNTTQYTLPGGKVVNLGGFDVDLIDHLKGQVLDLLHKNTDLKYEALEIVASEVFNTFQNHDAKCENCGKQISTDFCDLGGTVCNAACWIEMDNKPITMPTEEKVYAYLNSLKESNTINMLASIPYLIEEFSIDRKSAQEFFAKWAKQYGEKAPC